MSQPNPLTKYFRQPKIFIQLPSKGLYYPSGVLKGDYNNVPIFGMTGMDEIIFKTPDALYSGEASAKVIESCCPFIADAKEMPNIDVDAVLIAIRIATFGDAMTISHSCSACGEENNFDIPLQRLLDHFSSIEFTSKIQISDEITVKLRPISYQESSAVSLENFKLQRMLYQTNDLPEDQKNENLNQVYKRLAEIQVELFMTSIEQVQTPDATVTDKDQIKEWLKNTDSSVYKTIKDQLEKNKDTWAIPEQDISCGACGNKEQVSVTLDQSNFFD
jgi:hypothetical protein